MTVLLTSIVSSQAFDHVKLDSYFDALEQNDRFMGSVAISKDGHIIYVRSLGYIDLENQIKANEHAKYRIGSIAKTFTSVLVMQAVEAGKLALDQTLDHYFPQIEKAGQITISDMLQHRSGIHNFTNDMSYLTWHTQPKSETEMVAIIVAGGSDFEPGSRSEYSNANFILLSYILEKIYQKSYSDLLQERIAQPLGLVNTLFGGKINTCDKECLSYTFLDSWQLQSETDMTIPLGAGGIVSTASDIARFSDALFGGKLLSPGSLATMKNIKEAYGMGLFQLPFYDKIGYGHTGGIDGFTSIFGYFADGKISYALLSNGTRFDNNDISIAVLSALYDRPYDLPTFSAYEVSSEDLDQYLGVYASEQIPLKITITKENRTLMAQATGQAAFPLEATEKDIFKFDRAGVVLEFDPSGNTMVLKQGGGVFTFSRED